MGKAVRIFLWLLLLQCFLSGVSWAENLTVGNYVLVSQTRVGRTDIEYTYRASITNTDPVSYVNTTANVTSGSPSTVVVKGSLSFGEVPSGSTVQSTDTFTIRQNRLVPFSASNLSWSVKAVGPLRINNVDPNSALPGSTVLVDFTGYSQTGGPITASFSGQSVSVNIVPETTSKLQFQIPQAAKSGPFFVVQGSRNSNTIWYSVSNVSVVSPNSGLVGVDEIGNKISLSYILISFKDGFATEEQAQRIASIIGGSVVGRIPLISAYQISVNSNNISELRILIDKIKSDSAIDFILEDQLLEKEATDWDTDKGYDNQRESNKVKEGAELYNMQMSPTDTSKITPYFVSVGIIEDGVDFDTHDFKGYQEKGLGRFNNIAIYANDVNGNATTEEHGNVVTGIVAAEIGDGDQTTGKNAGLLQGLTENHGGFNITVKGGGTSNDGGKWASAVLSQTESALKEGASVINWSFGIQKEGALMYNGALVSNNVRSVSFFNSAKKAFEKLLSNIDKQYPKAVIVATAGNGNNLVDPAIRLPSALNSNAMIVVGGHENDSNTQRIDNTSWGSNYGERVHVAASGTVKYSNGNRASGTSVATPLVTATVAAIQSINPDLTPGQIKTQIRKSALPIENTVSLTKDGSPNGTSVFTASLTSAEVGTDATRLGKGARLNVEGAIQAAIDSRRSRTVPTSEPVAVDLPFGSDDVKVTVTATVPEGNVFDKVDILFLVDVTGSYGDDIAQFRAKATELISSFQTAGKDVQVGLASFGDYPISPYGGSSDYPYRLNQDLTLNYASVVSALNSLSIGWGNDGPESQLEALHRAATSISWRSGALPIIFLATDASFHNKDREPSYPGTGWNQTVSELKAKGIQVYGLQSGGNITDVINIASATGGQAFALSSNSSQIVTAVDTALKNASSSVDIKLVKNGDFADLIQSITPETGYAGVKAGESKNFEVTFSRHLWAKDETADHIFVLRLQTIADGVAVIHEIPVTVHVTFW